MTLTAVKRWAPAVALIGSICGVVIALVTASMASGAVERQTLENRAAILRLDDKKADRELVIEMVGSIKTAVEKSESANEKAHAEIMDALKGRRRVK